MTLPPFDECKADHLAISVRAYAETRAVCTGRFPREMDELEAAVSPKPSNWTLISDTETTTDPSQALRVGAYQVRKSGALVESGLFYAHNELTIRESRTVKAFAKKRELRLIALDVFIDEVLYPIGYELRATIVGFNLPFDIARVAFRFASARRRMRGGFSFRLSRDKRKPPIQVKHLSQRASLIRFAAPYRQPRARSARKRGTVGYVAASSSMFILSLRPYFRDRSVCRNWLSS